MMETGRGANAASCTFRHEGRKPVIRCRCISYREFPHTGHSPQNRNLNRAEPLATPPLLILSSTMPVAVPVAKSNPIKPRAEKPSLALATERGVPARATWAPNARHCRYESFGSLIDPLNYFPKNCKKESSKVPLW